jgi:hypothetical protein
MGWKEWLLELTPSVVELVKVLAGEEYDEAAEEQAILEFNRKLSDLRARRELRGAPPA